MLIRNRFEVTTLGQPLEVVKTTMAANRGDSFASALSRVWGRGGVFGCRLFPFNIYRLSTPKYTVLTSTRLQQSTKVLFPGPGSKPPPKEPSSSS